MIFPYNDILLLQFAISDDKLIPVLTLSPVLNIMKILLLDSFTFDFFRYKTILCKAGFWLLFSVCLLFLLTSFMQCGSYKVQTGSHHGYKFSTYFQARLFFPAPRASPKSWTLCNFLTDFSPSIFWDELLLVGCIFISSLSVNREWQSGLICRAIGAPAPRS